MDKKHQILRTPQVDTDITDSAKNKLKKGLVSLVQKFKEEDGFSKSEEHVQTSFTVKLLELLGWDSSSWNINQGQDVKTGKKPDIVLKSSTSKLLVIESKDAHKKDMLDGSYQPKTFIEQLLKYCSGEGVAWGVLTNFVEWRLYSFYQGRLYKDRKYAFYDLLWPNANKEDYIDLLSEDGLSFLLKLSRSFLLQTQGRIDQDTIYYPVQQDLGVEKIKKEFFEKIKVWRSSLRKYLLKNYPRIEADDLDLLAQKILDRLIFMDICHDKNVIGEDIIGQVKESKLSKYQELKLKFKQMDDKFNTELFSFKEYNQINEEDIKINDEVILPIITDLIEIDFSKLSVHIIGEVYENYLGELAKSRTTDEKKISDKQKQKRKSQGIYYTPDYIVDYIVKNTVGELLAKAKTTSEIEKIRVLDPACGSGSFLIRVFDEFLNAYRRVMKVPEGQTMWDEFIIRKKILQNNIFGVDLDAKAVEITKLNLMIKALDRIKPQDLKGNHLLPNLNLNIRCGNSLIGGEKLQEKEQGLNLFDNYKTEIDKLADLKISFYKESDDQKKKDLLAEIGKLEEVINKNINKGLEKYFSNLEKVNPFNYTVAFCEIFKDGGFDAVIGNPPYVKEYENRKIFEEAKQVLPQYYMGKMDIWYLFACKSIDLLKNGGYHSFIAQNNWITSFGAKKLREKILSDSRIISFVDFNAFKVFPEAGIQTMIYVVRKENPSRIYNVNYLRVIDKSISKDELKDTLNNKSEYGVEKYVAAVSPIKKEDTINFTNKEMSSVINSILNKSNLVLTEKEVAQGIVAPQEYVLDSHLSKIKDKSIKPGDGIFILKDKEFQAMKLAEDERQIFKPFYTTGELFRFGSNTQNKYWIIYTDKNIRKNIKKFPNIKNHLEKFAKVITSDFGPYGLHRARDEKFFKDGERMFSARKTHKPNFTYVNHPCYVSQTFFVIKPQGDINIKYLTAILNSQLSNFWFKNKGKRQGELLQIDKEPLLNFPIYQPDLSDKDDKMLHDKIVTLVDEMLKLNKTPESRDKNKTKIEAVDYEIDKIVYKLYCLTEEEIKIVDGK